MLNSIKSWKDIYSWKNIKTKDIIEKVIKHWDSDFIRQYAEKYDLNENYNWIDSILVSPHIKEEFRGYTFWSITKHPDFENIYIINIDSWRAQCLVDSKWKIHKIIWFHDRLKFVKVYLHEIMKMKLDTDAAWFVNGMATQTEFAIIFNKQKERLKALRGNYEFDSDLDSNVVFLQQREFRKESKEKVNQDEVKDWYWYNYNMFGDQSIFRKGYRKIDLWDLLESLQNINDLPEREKIILEVTTANYMLLKFNPNIFWILRNSRIAWIIINKVQSEWLWSIEHDTYRIINNDLSIKVVEH